MRYPYNSTGEGRTFDAGYKHSLRLWWDNDLFISDRSPAGVNWKLFAAKIYNDIALFKPIQTQNRISRQTWYQIKNNRSNFTI